jgi:hypothetical protein
MYFLFFFQFAYLWTPNKLLTASFHPLPLVDLSYWKNLVACWERKIWKYRLNEDRNGYLIQGILETNPTQCFCLMLGFS